MTDKVMTAEERKQLVNRMVWDKDICNCPTCNGSGMAESAFDAEWHTCLTCDGQGRLLADKEPL